MYFDPRLWPFTEGLRGRIAGAVAIGLASSLIGVARLALLGWLLGLVLAGRPLAELWLPVAGVAAVILLRGLVEYWRVEVAHETAARVQLVLRSRLYDQIVALGPAWFGLNRSGAVITALIEGVEQLEVYFGKYLPQLLVALLTPLAIFVCVAFLDLPVAAVLLFFALVTLLAPAAFHRWDQKNSLARAQAYRDYASEFFDSVQGLATLKAFGQSRSRAALLAEKAQEIFRRTMWVLATNSLTRGIADTGIALGAVAALALGAWRMSEGAMSLTELLVVLLLGVEVFRPLRDLRGLLHDAMLARSAAGSILELMDGEPSIADPDVEPGLLAPSLAFEQVVFAYPGGRAPAHRGLSFEVRAGERVGVVGASGCGKSSILRLLLRFYDPQAGRVTLGGRDLREIGFEALRGHYAIVGQDTYLFHGTVAENLRLGRPEASDAELRAAAEAAKAAGFIEALPQGYDTIVGERGIRLSGGQRQRIAIARALLRDAPILLLDEALSAVDADNEAAIQQALDRLMAGRTTLVLAHRLSSVIGCDRILVMDQGRIVEEGSHAELVARRGAYWRLMEEQLAGGAGEEGDRLPAAPAAAAVALPAAAGEDSLLRQADARAAVAAEPADAIVRAEGLSWAGVIRELLAYARPWKGRLTLTFLFGVARVAAFIGVGVVSALAVARLKEGEPVVGLFVLLFVLAPAAGILHWLESWIAHDMAFRLLATLRVQLFDKLDRLAPAFLVRRRSGDLVAMATHDVEMVEYFFAHTIAPAFVAVVVPAAVLATLAAVDWRLAAVLAPFLAAVALCPILLRRRIDRLAARAREALGALNAQAADSVQGLTELLAFQQAGARKARFLELVRRHHALRRPFFRELTAQAAGVEVATALGGLAIVLVGAVLVQDGSVDAALLPLFTIIAMSAFLPVSEIAEVGRQLADTLGATRRLHAVYHEPEPVTDGPLDAIPGRSAGTEGGVEVAFEQVGFTYPGQNRPALSGLGFTVPAGRSFARCQAHHARLSSPPNRWRSPMVRYNSADSSPPNRSMPAVPTYIASVSTSRSLSTQLSRG